ncbi:MAG TPA: hypothetical protein VJR87_12185 [Allosphingosinicella sp.]|nr:hypothetical protein [Allosphingosinicella sp.]
MAQARVMMIGLDGFELSLADDLIARGRLPNFARLLDRSAHVRLDHGPAKRTGLAWEHISSGLAPDSARRWSAVHFDAERYGIVQKPARARPFPASLDRRTVVFDVPYFDLAQAPEVRGLAIWGAHDPGVAQLARPSHLGDEIEARFGAYPARKWIYGFTWPSPEAARQMAAAIERAVQTRFAIAEWLFAERLPDWELGFFVVSEFHSAIEAQWHGIDPSHPLHGMPSAAAAGRNIEAVYELTDRALGRLIDRFDDVRFAIFAVHGMGPNDSDVASMALLPELLYRHSFGKPCMGEGRWRTGPTGVPVMEAGRSWETEVNQILPHALRYRPVAARIASSLRARLGIGDGPGEIRLDWMPAARYRRIWPQMRAFALPSFYDGQIRINLAGRERRGIVDPAEYESVCDDIEALLRSCRDSISGEPVVAAVERLSGNAAALDPSQADMVAVWKGAPLGLLHPTLGTIGPLPYRRPGGHSGKSGVAYFIAEGLAPGDYGWRSAFDVVPTVIDLLGAEPVAGLDGRSLWPDMRAGAEIGGAEPACRESIGRSSAAGGGLAAPPAARRNIGGTADRGPTDGNEETRVI